jgi:exodeoxyribonuclease VII large subunit
MDYRDAITVSQLNNYVKDVLFQDEFLRSVAVRGEIANLRNYRGHLYFTLKDEKSSVKAVMWQSHARQMKFLPEDGMEVIVTGSVSVFERDGVYQVYANFMEPSGLGALYAALEKLKSRLEKEGLFRLERKRPLPSFPKQIGLVTSIRGAAIKDIVSVGRRRYPGVSFVVCDTKVQGEGAPDSIVRSLKTLSRVPQVDVIIVSRGGGSQEDLFVFNDEKVARAIYDCPVPVVSAVGHERDTTIADLVADARAATPSAAAELVVPNAQQLKNDVLSMIEDMRTQIFIRIGGYRQTLSLLRSRPSLERPDYFLISAKDSLVSYEKDLVDAARTIIDSMRSKFEGLTGRLDALSPLKVLSRGYSLTRLLPSGKVVTEGSQAPVGSEVEIRLYAGSLICSVKESRDEE